MAVAIRIPFTGSSKVFINELFKTRILDSKELTIKCLHTYAYVYVYICIGIKCTTSDFFFQV